MVQYPLGNGERGLWADVIDVFAVLEAVDVELGAEIRRGGRGGGGGGGGGGADGGVGEDEGEWDIVAYREIEGERGGEESHARRGDTRKR